MSKNQQHSLHLFLSTVFFLIVTIFLLVDVWEEHKDFQKYEGGEVVFVTIESKPKIGRFNYAVYGAYQDGDRRYSGVTMKNCTLYQVGDEVACRVMPGNPLFVCNAGAPISPMLFIKYCALAVVTFLCLMSAYSLYRHQKMMNSGFSAIGTVKSAVEKDELFFGLVEFTDNKGNLQLAEICFEKRMVVRGQRFNIKYNIHEDGTVEAYYHDKKDY